MKRWWTVAAVGAAVFVAGLVGISAGLFTGPVQTTLMSAAPAHLMGTAGALSGLARSLGFALGPALASAVCGYAGSGVVGMRASLYAMLAVAALVVVAAWTGRSAPGPPARPTLKEEVG